MHRRMLHGITRLHGALPMQSLICSGCTYLSLSLWKSIRVPSRCMIAVESIKMRTPFSSTTSSNFALSSAQAAVHVMWACLWLAHTMKNVACIHACTAHTCVVDRVAEAAAASPLYAKLQKVLHICNGSICGIELLTCPAFKRRLHCSEPLRSQYPLRCPCSEMRSSSSRAGGQLAADPAASLRDPTSSLSRTPPPTRPATRRRTKRCAPPPLLHPPPPPPEADVAACCWPVTWCPVTKHGAWLVSAVPLCRGSADAPRLRAPYAAPPAAP